MHSEIRLAGRNTQGVRLISLDEDDAISDVAAVVSEDEESPSTPGNAVKPQDGQAELFPAGGTGESQAGKTNGAAETKPDAPAPRPAREAKAPAAGKKPAGADKKPSKPSRKKKK